MSKQNTIDKLIKLLAHAISHKIGSIVNKDDHYAERYSKEAINFFNLAMRASEEENWNLYDKSIIKKLLNKKLISELSKREYLDVKKFDLIDKEIEKALDELGLKI